MLFIQFIVCLFMRSHATRTAVCLCLVHFNLSQPLFSKCILASRITEAQAMAHMANLKLPPEIVASMHLPTAEYLAVCAAWRQQRAAERQAAEAAAELAAEEQAMHAQSLWRTVLSCHLAM